ncbi:DHHA2 domain-containing protein [Salinispira pacifica]
MEGRPLIVVGHKNPDTDSICSAIAYAHLKSITGTPARPYRAGNLNAQTRFVLERFGVASPQLLTDLYPRLSDIMIGESELIALHPQEPIGRARAIMLEKRFTFLPVTDDAGRCLGKVSLLGIAAAPELIARIRTGRQITFYPEELLTRTEGWTGPGWSLPARVSGTVVAPALDGGADAAGTVTAAGTAAPDSVAAPPAGRAGEDAGTVTTAGMTADANAAAPGRILILPKAELARYEAEHSTGADDLILAYGAVKPDRAGPKKRGRGASRVLHVPRGLVETLLALYESQPLTDHIESAEPLFAVHDLVRRTEREINRYNAGGFIVTDEEGALRGVITRLNFLNRAQFQVVLVDHNELAQAVDGAEHAEIVEVIDHHRLGARSTELPITFINRVVGSTCTIIADMYRAAGIDPGAQMAGLMLSALLSDTVILKSPTATSKDHEIAAWLSGVAGVDIEQYGEEMFAAGSELAGTAPDSIIGQDQKIYEESGFKFAVSQIEMVGFKSFQERSTELAAALEASRERLGCAFACLLVTDITRETSLLLYAGEPRIAEAIQYPHAGRGIYEMHGMLSRKKQLLPYLLDVLKNL